MRARGRAHTKPSVTLGFYDGSSQDDGWILGPSTPCSVKRRGTISGAWGLCRQLWPSHGSPDPAASSAGRAGTVLRVVSVCAGAGVPLRLSGDAGRSSCLLGFSLSSRRLQQSEGGEVPLRGVGRPGFSSRPRHGTLGRSPLPRAVISIKARAQARGSRCPSGWEKKSILRIKKKKIKPKF